jgi:hypothetical protein
MLRRAFSWLLSTLMLLALLLALPQSMSMAGASLISAIEPRPDACAAVANGPLDHREQVASDQSQWTDDEEGPGPIARAKPTGALVTSSDGPTLASVLSDTHPACAQFARGPPPS